MIESPTAVLRRYGLSARKSWGQNFLHDMAVHRAIAAAAGVGEGGRVVEIGAGVGTLTAHLLGTGAEVWAVERDRDLCDVLRREFAERPRLLLFEADAVKFEYERAADTEHPRPAIVGNLPYHLTGALLYALLQRDRVTGPWVVMIQREVADRLCAPPGSRVYGGMTVGLSRVRAIRRVMSVPPGSFSPQPKVDSAVIRFDPRPAPLGDVADEQAFLALVRTAFQQRRKTVMNALSALAPKDEVLRWCAVAGVDPKLRPEKLSSADFAALQRAREEGGGA